MREIKLTQGKVSLVDDEDFEYLNQWKWHAYKRHGNFYARRNFYREDRTRTTIDMHIAITGEAPEFMIRDHIDGNGLNNQRHNLRFVTNRQNRQNLHVPKTSRYPGVHFDRSSRRWVVRIGVGGSVNFIGRFRDEEAAFRAYCNALDRIGEVLIERAA